MSLPTAPARAHRVLAVCGSLQSASSNLTLLRHAAAAAPAGVSVTLFDGLANLPHFNPDLAELAVPEAVAAWRRALSTHDAVLIACPEYGFSLPGSLKNAIDWVIGTGELEGKVVGITAAVSGPTRGLQGLSALQQTLRAVRARIVGGAPIVRGPHFERDVEALLGALLREREKPDPVPAPEFHG